MRQCGFAGIILHNLAAATAGRQPELHVNDLLSLPVSKLNKRDFSSRNSEFIWISVAM